jgi:4-diphosphocytidyl-2-C-methyl-D-erythritol kinase
LLKRVPSGAGLGGGSSNAAAALRGALALCGLEREPAFGTGGRAEVLAELGSDTVFFEAARATGRARCTGRGEVVEPLDPLPTDAVFQLATPEFHGATAGVYGRLSERRSAESAALPHAGSEANDLAAAAFDLEPRLAELQSALGRAWQLTGSGSTFFKRAAGRDAESAAHAWRLWTVARPWRAGGTP